MGVLLAVFGICLSLTGCTSLRAPNAILSQDTTVKLPPPERMTQLYRESIMTIRFSDAERTVHTVVEANDNSITVAAFTLAGLHLITIRYDNTGIATRVEPLAEDLPPAEQILADIMLIHCPLAAWSDRLPKAWTLRDEASHIRRLRDVDGRIIVGVEYQVESPERYPKRLDHVGLGYVIEFRPLDQELQ